MGWSENAKISEIQKRIKILQREKKDIGTLTSVSGQPQQKQRDYLSGSGDGIIEPDPSDIDSDLQHPGIDDQDASGAFENDKKIRDEIYDQLDDFEEKLITKS